MTLSLDDVTCTPEDPDGPVARDLIRQLSVELAARYPEDPDEGGAGFDPAGMQSVPGAVFLVAWSGGQAIGCGAVRPFAPRVGELKRMFVVPEARRRGIARQTLAALETFALQAGYARLCLQTAVRQPEALALYAASGYVRIPCYGAYAEDPLSVCYGKSLTGLDRGGGEG